MLVHVQYSICAQCICICICICIFLRGKYVYFLQFVPDDVGWGGETGNDAEKPHTKAHMCVLLMCNPIPIILLCILSVFHLHLYLYLYLNLYLYLYLKKPHTQAHMCVLLMCNPTPHPDGIKIAKSLACDVKLNIKRNSRTKY